eukprot:PhM_4_TR3779/c0_g1_i1/m.8417
MLDIFHIQKRRDAPQRVVRRRRRHAPHRRALAVRAERAILHEPWVVQRHQRPVPFLANVRKQNNRAVAHVGLERPAQRSGDVAEQRAVDHVDGAGGAGVAALHLQGGVHAIAVRDHDALRGLGLVGAVHGDVVEGQHLAVGAELLLPLAHVEQRGAVDAHDDAAVGDDALLDGVRDAAHVVAAVGVAHNVDARGAVQHVGRVEVPPEDAAVEALQTHEHAVGLAVVCEPRHQRRLVEHVRGAVNVLGVGHLNDRQQPGVGEAHTRAHERGLVGREVADAVGVLLDEALRDDVVAAVLNVLAEIDGVLVARQQTVVGCCHVFAHHGGRLARARGDGPCVDCAVLGGEGVVATDARHAVVARDLNLPRRLVKGTDDALPDAVVRVADLAGGHDAALGEHVAKLVHWVRGRELLDLLGLEVRLLAVRRGVAEAAGDAMNVQHRGRAAVAHVLDGVVAHVCKVEGVCAVGLVDLERVARVVNCLAHVVEPPQRDGEVVVSDDKKQRALEAAVRRVLGQVQCREEVTVVRAAIAETDDADEALRELGVLLAESIRQGATERATHRRGALRGERGRHDKVTRRVPANRAVHTPRHGVVRRHTVALRTREHKIVEVVRVQRAAHAGGDVAVVQGNGVRWLEHGAVDRRELLTARADGVEPLAEEGRDARLAVREGGGEGRADNVVPRWHELEVLVVVGGGRVAAAVLIVIVVVFSAVF